jgi:hypothetical protein
MLIASCRLTTDLVGAPFGRAWSERKRALGRCLCSLRPEIAHAGLACGGIGIGAALAGFVSSEPQDESENHQAQQDQRTLQNKFLVLPEFAHAQSELLVADHWEFHFTLGHDLSDHRCCVQAKLSQQNG